MKVFKAPILACSTSWDGPVSASSPQTEEIVVVDALLCTAESKLTSGRTITSAHLAKQTENLESPGRAPACPCGPKRLRCPKLGSDCRAVGHVQEPKRESTTANDESVFATIVLCILQQTCFFKPSCKGRAIHLND